MPEREQDAGSGDAREVLASEALYSRTMPGGGYVRVELLVSEPGAVVAERSRGRVIMECRAPALAMPDERVIVEEVEGDDPNSVVDELFRIARDNAAIARRVLRRRSARAD